MVRPLWSMLILNNNVVTNSLNFLFQSEKLLFGQWSNVIQCIYISIISQYLPVLKMKWKSYIFIFSFCNLHKHKNYFIKNGLHRIRMMELSMAKRISKIVEQKYNVIRIRNWMLTLWFWAFNHQELNMNGTWSK